MAVNLSPVGGVAAQFFTNTGAVLTGGKLYTYLAGTTTPAVAYTSSQGTTAWTNPIVLDAAGRVSGSGEIWLTDGIIYKFVLKDSNDVLIATYDNITGINSNSVAYTNQQEIVTATAGQTVFNLSISYQPGTNSLSVFVDGVNQYGPGALYSYVETDSNTVTFNSGLHVGAEVKFTTTQQQGAGAVDASQVTYDPPFTGSVATNVEAKLAQTVSVMDFGAVGDGVADDTAAIQAALTEAKQVFLPTGEYRITTTVSIPSDGALIGAGFGSVILNDSVYRGIFTSGNAVVIANLRVNCTGSTTGHVDGRGAIHLENATNCSVSNVRVYGARSAGISCGSCTGLTIANFSVDTTLEHGLYLSDSDRVTVTNGVIVNAGQLEPLTLSSGTGFKIAACTDVTASNIQTINSIAYGCIVEGYITKSAERINLSNLDVQGNSSGYSGLRITNYVDGLNVIGGTFRGDYGVTLFSSDSIGIPQNVNLVGINAIGINSYAVRVYYGIAVKVFGGILSSYGGGNSVYVNATAGAVQIFGQSFTTNGSSTTTGFSVDLSGNLIPLKSTQNLGSTVNPVASTISTLLAISDGVSAPSTVANYALIYVDTADGDLKIKFGDGTVKTIVTD
jgi:hypothetical protein